MIIGLYILYTYLYINIMHSLHSLLLLLDLRKFAVEVHQRLVEAYGNVTMISMVSMIT